MPLRNVAVIVVVFTLAGCNSHEGLYAPSCVAYAGDKIELRDGQFIWEKFTDALIIDDDGNLVNQFPGYPMRGSYSVDGDTVLMEAESGEALENMYLRQHGDRYYLVTAAQFEEWKSAGKYGECVLILGGNRRE